MKGGKGRRKGRHASTQAPVRNNLFLLCLDMGCLPRNPNKIPKIKNFIVFSCVALALTRSTFIPPSLRALPGADIPIICCLRQGQHTRVKTNNNLQIVLAQGRQAYNKLCVFIVGPRCRRRNRRKKESTKGPQKEPPGLNHFIICMRLLALIFSLEHSIRWHPLTPIISFYSKIPRFFIMLPL